MPYPVAPAHWMQMISPRLRAGWSPTLITFMFDRIPGDREAIRRRQAVLVAEAYSRFVTRAIRRPAAPSARDRLPIWLCFPDFPVRKNSKQDLHDIIINDGQHVHGFGLTPPDTRLKTSTPDHFESNQRLYTHKHGLARIHAVPIIYDFHRVADYVTKSLSRGVVDPDSIMIFPRCRSEMRHC